ncbi:carbohydrate ABC transporter permease [Eubacterium multiforme]|uniref:Multiple sugar transport system permease protein n=1 Tax=Eubacterium multiforme TaxID=83339 RepID=A0ABT9UNT2_9FIRM|nr:carbohydrate ABC transporter permease [Eubacterium multiforme]MDQ0148298.1 multiple sugar transport system permease protein [Eubacterium multiforme]
MLFKKKKEKEELYDWRNQWTPKHIMSFMVLCLFTVIFIFPFYWIITGAFKDQGAAIAMPPQWFPAEPIMQNWLSLAKQPLARWTFNSFFIAISTTFLVCLTSALAGYVLAKKRFPGRKIAFWLLIVAMALPKQVIMVPLFNILTSLNWIDTYKSLILPAVGWPFGIFLMKQFSETIPTELIEAAKIDGCSELSIFKNIVIPIVKPGIAALGIFTFISSWNDYFMQLILIRSKTMQTLPLGIATMQLEFATDYGLMMAGAALASIPMIIIFLMFQKSFTQGITIGAVKG